MKTIKTTSFLFFLLFSFSCLNLFSQVQGDAPFVFHGKATANDKNLSEVNVVVSKDGKQVQNYTTGKDGKFYIDKIIQSTTNKNNTYKVEFSKEGYVTKTVDINTYKNPED